MKKGSDWFIWCGPEKLARREVAESERTLTLNTLGRDPNVHLKLFNINSILAREVPPLLLDCLEIASYVYAADQSVRRGGATLPGDGESWRRSFRFNIPVRELGTWQSTPVREALVDTLSFLTEDYYEFSFRRATRDFPTEPYFEFEKGEPWFKADEVMLFSGGLDSLAGLVQSSESKGCKVALVSHRAAPQLSARQKDLLKEFQEVTNGRHKVLHIPVWVNKSQQLTKDINQRSRSFLFTMLGVVVANMHSLDAICFYENGITSCNLPISEQLVGSRASRTTHPLALKYLSALVSSLLNRQFAVKNPLFWKTKADEVKSIGDKGLGDLIRFSCSCSHIRTSGRVSNHCGVCSQCIDRRMAVLASEMASNDPEELYQIRCPLDAIKGTENRTMVMSYLETARNLDKMSIDDFFAKYGEASRILGSLDMNVRDAAQRLFELHKRHGSQVRSAMTQLVHEHADLISQKLVHPESLLAMIVSDSSKEKTADAVARFKIPEGYSWEDITIDIVSRDSIVIHVAGINKRYHAFDLGFRDGRRADMLNQQWESLEELAAHEGVVNWIGPVSERRINSKRVQELNKTLKKFFGLPDNPISHYRRGVGWVARFTIKDKSFGKS